MLLSFGLGHRQTSTLKGLYIKVHTLGNSPCIHDRKPPSYTSIYIFYYTVTCSRHHGVGAHHAKKRATVKEKQSLRNISYLMLLNI